jgi:hypothetical protein
VSADESSMMLNVRIPSKCARSGITSFELCEDKPGYVRNFIIYTGKDKIFDESLKN